MWPVLFLLALPAVLLVGLLAAYVAVSIGLSGKPPSEEELTTTVLPLVITVNHLTVFAVLMIILRKEGCTLADIGWSGEMRVSLLFGQFFVALSAALILYLFKEVMFDPVRAYMAGQEPTFHSLFRFNNLETDEYGLLLVAMSFVFVEESIYRGYAIPRLAARWGLPAAIAVSSVFFGLLHIGNGPEAFVFTIAAGMIYAVIFLTFSGRRLWGLSAGHALYNAMILMT